MSLALTWEPKVRQKKELSFVTKQLLRKRYGDPVNAELNVCDLQYLQGLFDVSDDEGIASLIAGINDHGTIILKEV